tara:strand:+ start:483 stop:677 length:195 start_codon:yes stop_codon:yes gene_type:complete
MGQFRFIVKYFSKKERAIDRLLEVMKVEKQHCLRYLLVKDWEMVNHWLEKSKKTIRAVRKIMQL